MILSSKRVLLLLLLASILLIGLLSWTLHMVATPITPTYPNTYHSRNCPPPPYDCW
jgi:hypothetical protein